MALLPGIDVIRLLVMAQFLNGTILPIVLVTMLRLVNDPEVLGEHVNSRGYNVVAVTTAAVVALLSVAYLAMVALEWLGIL